MSKYHVLSLTHDSLYILKYIFAQVNNEVYSKCCTIAVIANENINCRK